MTPDDVLRTQTRWRTLTVRRPANVVQFFADYSPEAWWYSRYLPSKTEAGHSLQSAFLTKTGFATQVNLALADARAKYAIFHRRTITHQVFSEINNLGVPGVFVVPEPWEISRNPTMPLNEWAAMLSAARAGKCQLVSETLRGVEDLQRLGVGAWYLPPLHTVPGDLRVEATAPSEHYRVLLAAEAYPHLDLFESLMLLQECESDCTSGKPLKVILSLGDGPHSAQESYRDGIFAIARGLFGDRLEIWPRTSRTVFLRRLARDVDAVLDPEPYSAISYEAAAMNRKVWIVVGRSLVDGTIDNDVGRLSSARREFWGGLR